MIETRHFIRNKVMTDFDPSSLPKDGIESAYNIHIDNSKEGNFGVVTDIKGNRLISYPLRPGLYEFVGGGGDDVLNKYWSFFEHDGGYHIVLEFDKTTETITKIFEDLTDSDQNPVLGISAAYPFTGFNVFDLGGEADSLGLNTSIMLTWCDAKSEPHSMYPDYLKKIVVEQSIDMDGNSINGSFSNDYIGKFISIDEGVSWKKILHATESYITVHESDPYDAGTVDKYLICSSPICTKSDFLIAKQIPTVPIAVNYTDDSELNANRLKDQLFQFTYQYIYKDGTDSAYAPYSKVAYPSDNLDPLVSGDLTKNNTISLVFNTGSKNVSHIRLAFRKVNSADKGFYSIIEIDKEAEQYLDNRLAGYSFRNDENYMPLPISEFANRLYDNVPLIARAQTVVNGNQLIYGDVDLNEDTVPVDMGMEIKYLGAETSTTTNTYIAVTMSGAYPNAKATVRITGESVNIGDKASVRFERDETRTFPRPSGDPGDIRNNLAYFVATNTSIVDFANGLVNSVGSTPNELYTIWTTTPQATQAVFTSQGYYEFVINLGVWCLSETHSFVPTELIGEAVSAVVHKSNSSYSYGLVYGDDEGRTTGVCLDSTNIVKSKSFAETFGAVSYMEYSIFSKPPKWATWWSLVRTKNLTHSKFLYIGASATAPRSGGTVLTNLEVISIKSLLGYPVDGNLSYSFAKGDRIRFVRNLDNNDYLTENYDTEIVGEIISDADYQLRIVVPNGLTTAISGTTFIVEIYSPAKPNAINAYYETGEVYPILNPFTPDRTHGCNAQNQTSSEPAKGLITDGDVFIRKRNILTNPDPNDPRPPREGLNSTARTVEDAHFSDFYPSKATSEGRAFVQDNAIKRRRYRSKMLFTDPILPGYRGNGSNKIYAGNVFDEIFDSKGAIKKLTTRGDYLLVLQENGVCAVPIHATMIDVGTDALQMGLSRKLLNRPRYYTGNYGIENAVRSFAQKDNNIYFACPSRGSIIRIGFDGATNMTDVTFTCVALSELIKQDGVNNSILGCFNNDNNQYTLHFKSSGETWTFDEGLKGFEGTVGFVPDGLDCMGDTLLTFKNGELWLHDDKINRNRFYGEQQNSELTFLVNDSPDLKKIFLNGSISSSGGWYIEKLETSDGESEMFINDFEENEGVYYSEFPMNGLSDGGLLNGDPLRGNWLRIKMKKVGNVKHLLKSVSVSMIPSGKNMV